MKIGHTACGEVGRIFPVHQNRDFEKQQPSYSDVKHKNDGRRTLLH